MLDGNKVIITVAVNGGMQQAVRARSSRRSRLDHELRQEFFASRPAERILVLNRWMREDAAAHGVVYLDYYSAMVDDRGMLRRDLAEDGLHPNATGYAIMARLADEGIQRALTQDRRAAAETSGRRSP